MRERDFLKRGSGVAGGGAQLARLAAERAPVSAASATSAAAAAEPAAPRPTRTNWAGNYTYSTGQLDLATHVDQVLRSLAGQTPVKALGARHSFNAIADSTGRQVSLRHMDSIELDTLARTVTVGAGVTYGELAPYLDSRGFAVHNLASLPHIGVVGACQTATHGSGSSNGNLSTAVRAMEMLTARGEQVTLSRRELGDRFAGVVVGLGALGIVTRITLAVEPAFQMTQQVYQNLSFSRLESHLDAIFASGYSVSLFTDWQQHRATQVWIKRRADRPGDALGAGDFYGATPARRKLHPLAGHSAENCTEQMGIVGPWYERLPHFRMNFTPSSGAEIQSEYFVPREKGYAAILAVEQLRDAITPHLLVSEFRAVAADDLWMSPCYRRPSLALHFTWKPDAAPLEALLPAIEAKLSPFQPRPHWAKVFTMAPSAIQQEYAQLAGYKALLAAYDPEGKFRNAFLETNLYG